MASTYWKPVYKYLRLAWRAPVEEAEDLTQGFFTEAFARKFFEAYNPQKAKFRTFVRLCLDRFVQNENKAQKRLKRGGGAVLVSLDVEGAESELARVDPPEVGEMDAFFEEEWRREIFTSAVEALRAHCEARRTMRHFRVFELYDLRGGDEATSYPDVASELGLSVSDVTNSLRYARREFRRLVLERVHESSTSEEHFAVDARGVFRESP